VRYFGYSSLSQGGGGSKGGSDADGASIPTSDFRAVNAAGEEEADEVECVPLSLAANMAQDLAKGAARSVSFSVQ